MKAGQDFDVVIVGGGMVGAAVAALLATQRATARLSIAVLEPRPVAPPLADEPFDIRVSAVSRGSQRLLEHVGAWPAIAARGAGPYRRMVVWDAAGSAGGEGSISFDAADLGEPDLGHLCENRAIQAALTERAMELGVTLLRANVEGLELGAEAAQLALGDGRRLSAALVVAADGADSAIRGMAGIDTKGWAYGQHGVVANLQPALPHGETAYQRFLPTGPLALLPLADGRVSIVWSTTQAEAESLLALDDAAFGMRVTEASCAVLGELAASGPRGAFPLRLIHALEYTRPRLALVGDAAHAVHPLAGQGVNLGFMDAAALAEVLGQSVATGADAGDPRALRRYERWRKAENLPAMAMFDGLKRLFSNSDPVLSWARRSGLSFFDAAAPVKRLLMRRALGTVGDVPAIMRR
ncbi:MAG: UbiH/UbiF/VisC/COQ6 family ubiquinone biosynthesis hydroxylase [Gammaproteobacteria bacterium]|nr:UbiH/UbiF/VisC/COQ6 family ubiquinone biosynthesis hydroxylase [Gammaproteobacteria bacterium]